MCAICARLIEDAIQGLKLEVISPGGWLISDYSNIFVHYFWSEVAKFLEPVEDSSDALLDGFPVGFDDQFGMEWLFVGIIDAGEALDLALVGQLIEALHIALATDLDGTLYIDFNEVADVTARPVSGLPIGRDSGGDARDAVAREQATHKRNALDVGITVFLAET